MQQKIKIAAAVPEVSLMNCKANAEQIVQQIQQAAAQGIDLLCFPELSITGATCGDLFHNELLLSEAEKSLQLSLSATKNRSIVTLLGLPICHKNSVYKITVAFAEGKLLGVVPAPLSKNEKSIFDHPLCLLAEKQIELCGQTVSCNERLIATDKFSIAVASDFSLPAISADILVIPAALPAMVGQAANIRQQAAELSSKQAVVFVSAGFGESTTDGVFAGQALIASGGKLLAETELYACTSQLIAAEVASSASATILKNELPATERSRSVEASVITPTPFLPQGISLSDCCAEAFAIQTQSLITRLHRTGIKKVLVGISGGLDSTLALLVCANAFDKMNLPRTNITGITMPGFGTTGRTYQNAVELIKQLGASFREISIKNACLQHFSDINQPTDKHDATYENAQARERTQILMDIANQQGGLVVGTGDLSELALGWATYGGDHLSMYCVNGGVPKTMVRNIVNWAADTEQFLAIKTILHDIIDTPVSPELLPADDAGCISQKTEDLVGPYELHDFFLYYLLKNGYSPAHIQQLAAQEFSGRYDDATIQKWLRIFVRRFFTQHFKRSCMPDGPQVFAVSLSPRSGFSMPSDALVDMWLGDLG
jgi:NAD+ synthase (glutamine-hydrolysing)